MPVEKLTDVSKYENVVQSLYITLFGRPADPAGLLSFETALANANAPTNLADIFNAKSSPAIQAVLKTFTDSTEFKSVFTETKSAVEIVSSLYQNAFGKSPAPNQILYYGNQILTGSLTPAEAALEIASSSSSDLDYKIVAASNFTKAVNDLYPNNNYDGTSFKQLGTALLNNASWQTSYLNIVDAAKSVTAAAPPVDPNIATIETAYLAVTGSPAPPDQLASLASQWKGKSLSLETVVDFIGSNDKSNSFGLDPSQLSDVTTVAMFETQTINSIFEHLYNRAPTTTELTNFSIKLDSYFLEEAKGGRNPSAKDIGLVLIDIVNQVRGSKDLSIFVSKISAATALSQSNLPSPLYDQTFAKQTEQKFLNSITSTTSASDITAQVKSILSDINAANIAPHQETQTITDMNSNSGQLVDLGKNPSIFEPVVTPNGLPGFTQTQLTYTVDKNGLLTFQGTLVSALTPEQKATIIDNIILKNDTSHVIFFNDGGNGYAVRNDGDHFVQFTDHTITGGNDGWARGSVDGLVKLVGIDYSAGSSGDGGGGGGYQCDVRLKKNISFVRTTEDGVKLYEFAYHGDEQRFIGPMAQDLIADERFAHSVRKNESGFYQVNFSAIGIKHLASKALMDAGMNAVQMHQQRRDG